MDNQTTLIELRQTVRRFMEERDWQRYHSPKNLAASIAIEAAELMEHFQWHTSEESRLQVLDPEKKAEVSGELADVLIYCLVLANQMDVDISDIVEKTLDRNNDRYPVGYMPT